jgi:hypothetical protein
MAQITRNIGLGAQVGIEYDSNVARASEAVADARGIQRDDTIITPALTADITQPIGRQYVFLQGSVGYSFYAANDDLNRETADVVGGIGTRVGPCQGTISVGFTRRERGLEELVASNPRELQNTTTATLQQVCGLTGGLGASFSASSAASDSSGSSIDRLDYTTTSVSAGLVYRRSTLGEASLFASYGKTEYDEGLPFSVPGYDVTSIGVSYSRNVGSRITGSASISQTWVESESPFGVDSSGINYAFNVGYRPSERLNVSASWTRDIRPSAQLGRNYSIREGVGIDASYRLGSRMTYTIGASQRKITSRGGLPVAGIIVLTDSRLNEFNTGLRFDLNDRISFSLDGSYSDYGTSNPLYDYTATRVGLTTSVAF